MARPDEFGDDLGQPVGSASAPQRSRGRSGGKRSKKKGQGSSTAKVVLIVLGVMGILGLALVIGVGFWIYNAVSAGVDQLEQTVAEADFEQLIDEGVSELESAQQEHLQNTLLPQASPGFSGPGEFMDEPDGPLPEETLTLEQAAESGLQISLHLTREEPLEVFGFFPNDAVFALLSFQGPLVASGFAYGHFDFDAVDDTGRKLTLAEPLHGQFGGDPSAEFIELDHFFLERPDELVLAMGITGPARGAKQMKSFNGSLKLRTRTTVVVDNVRSKVGETLDDEHLKAAGPFMIVRPTEQDGDANSTVVVVCRGSRRQQHDVRLIDSDGQEYHTAVWRHHSDDESRYALESTQPLPDGIGLRITLAGSARELTVPFAFENVALNDGKAVMFPGVPDAGSSDATADGDQARVIPASFEWDLESDDVGANGETGDLTWRYRNETERGLVALNGAALVRIADGEFDEIDRSYLENTDYPRKIVPGSLNNNRLRPGTVLGLRTAEGNYAKLRVKGYVALHDFSFPGASILTEDWKEFALNKPNRTDYHIEVEWVLFEDRQ